MMRPFSNDLTARIGILHQAVVMRQIDNPYVHNSAGRAACGPGCYAGDYQRLATSHANSIREWHVVLGSMHQTLDDAGAVLESVQYDPWGVPTVGAPQAFGFTGELHSAG